MTLEFLRALVSSGLIPLGDCYRWTPRIVWLHVASDILIALSYYCIARMLVHFVRRRRGLSFKGRFLLFWLFIVGCGTTHLMEVWTVWHADYLLSGIIKAMTAAAAVATAILFIALLPKALALLTPTDLKEELQERTRTEEQLRSSQQRSALALKAGHCGTFDWDIKKNVNQWSPEIEALYGIEPGGFGGTLEDWEQCLIPEGLAAARASVAESMKTGNFAAEWRIRRKKDGQIRWIRAHARVLSDEAGQPSRMIGVNFDVTERKHSEESLRAAEERFRLLVEGVKDYVTFTMDPAGRIATWNKGAERLKGYTASEVVGKHISLFYPEEDQTAGKAQLELETAERDGECADEGWRVRKDGSRFWARVVITALKENDGTLLGFSKFTRDMTASKKAEEELKYANDLLMASNQELEAFNYTAAHDLRAPLRHMHGFVGILRKAWYDKLDDDGRQCLDKISTSSKEMGLLLDDLLNFSRLGQVDLQQSRVSLGQLASGIWQELEPERRGRALTWEIGELPDVDGDPTLLHQVLFNLLSNAVKYTRKQANAHIEIGSQNGTENNITVFVRDNGAGFEMEYVDKLFRVFQRLHKTQDFEGTGIGLAIVRRIVERHGGRAWAEGAPGQGATFYFSLPVKDKIKEQHNGQARLHFDGR